MKAIVSANLACIPRFYSSGRLSFKKGSSKLNSAKAHVQPSYPARTRFAPSPTGLLHMGSLRTALYNYLLAKSTGGTFVLRLEDTDQERLISGAEKNIYESLAWCGIKIDEGPQIGGPFGPYRQSDRSEIYKKYVNMLVESGQAYKCYCSKERLIHLRESASKLKPPTNVTYDRKCMYDSNVANNSEYTIRFKSPDSYASFTDLLHGQMNLQPQYNSADRRYDDFVIMKSNGLPTYHFANVVDDHLMKITHVIRGEEWLASTPKHVALYKAFGWDPPKFIHIPLLTSTSDQKLSKRKGDLGVLSLREKGILPEALVNFSALFGWSPPRLNHGVSSEEYYNMDALIKKFSLDNLTKGNAKVELSKLNFFNKHYLSEKLKNDDTLSDILNDYYPKFKSFAGEKYSKENLRQIIDVLGPSLVTINDIEEKHYYLFKDVNYVKEIQHVKLPVTSKPILKYFTESAKIHNFEGELLAVTDNLNVSKADVYISLRFALTGGISGMTIPKLLEFLGTEEALHRIKRSLEYI